MKKYRFTRQLFLVATAILLLAANSFSQRTHGLGLKFDDPKYKQTEGVARGLKMNFKTASAYSLKAYCPTPGDQKNIPSCVGWATGYSALTTAYAQQKGITDQAQKDAIARSAMYLYKQIDKSNCSAGTFIGDALEVVKAKGDCKFTDFKPEDCQAIPDGIDASISKLSSYLTLFNTDDIKDIKIKNTRESIASNKPVIIGLRLTNSFYTVSTDGNYVPSGDEIGGHALCVIGYDDPHKRFEVINSWGTDWGNNGFFYISYDDYYTYCKYGYQFILEPSKQKVITEILTGNFQFKIGTVNNEKGNYDFNEIVPHLQGSYYTFDDGQIKTTDFFRIVTSRLKKDSYVYIFSVKPDGNPEVIFPMEKLDDDGHTIRVTHATRHQRLGWVVKDQPVVPVNSASVEIPIDPHQGLNPDQAGTDYLCILYSKEPIDDIEDVVNGVANSLRGDRGGDFYTKLQGALGDRLIPQSDIQYSDHIMGMTTRPSSGSVAPIILKVNVQQ